MTSKEANKNRWGKEYLENEKVSICDWPKFILRITGA